MAFSVATGVLIVLLYTISMRYLFQGSKIQRIEWDMTMVTARDFSTEFPIKQASYDKWKEEVYEAPDGPKEQKVPPAFALKQDLIEEIEKKMDRWVADNPWAIQELFDNDKKKNKKNINEEYVKKNNQLSSSVDP